MEPFTSNNTKVQFSRVLNFNSTFIGIGSKIFHISLTVHFLEIWRGDSNMSFLPVSFVRPWCDLIDCFSSLLKPFRNKQLCAKLDKYFRHSAIK